MSTPTHLVRDIRAIKRQIRELVATERAARKLKQFRKELQTTIDDPDSSDARRRSAAKILDSVRHVEAKLTVSAVRT